MKRGGMKVHQQERLRLLMMPPRPLQTSHSLHEERQWQIEAEDQIWSALDRTVIAKTKQYLEESCNMKVEVEESESLLGPEDSEVDFRRILEQTRNKQGRAIFETFSSEWPSELLVVSRARWDEHLRKMSVQNEELRRTPITLQQVTFFSSLSERQWQADLDEQRDGWSLLEKRVIAAMEDYLEKCINIQVEIAALELLMGPKEAEVCLRYILKRAKRRGCGIFEILDSEEREDHFVASRIRWLEYQGERVALQENGQNDWQDVKYERKWQKPLPPCPERSMKTPLPQQRSSSTRERKKVSGFLWKRRASGASPQRRGPRECWDT